jgi:hypothetical protein
MPDGAGGVAGAQPYRIPGSGGRPARYRRVCHGDPTASPPGPRRTFSRPQAGRRQPSSSERRTQFPSPAPSPAPAAVVHKRRPGRQHPHRVLHRLIPRPGETRVDGFLRPCHRASARGLREGNGPRSVRGRQSAVQRPNGDLGVSTSGNGSHSPAAASRFAARAATGQQTVDLGCRKAVGSAIVARRCRLTTTVQAALLHIRRRILSFGRLRRSRSHWPGRCIDNRLVGWSGWNAE